LEYYVIIDTLTAIFVRSGGLLDNRKPIKTKRTPARTTAKSRTTRLTIVLSAAVVVIVGILAGIAIYRDRVAPFNTIVLEVNGAQVKMRYFLKRVAMSDEPPIDVLQMIAKEEMIKLAAENPPFNITVTDENIDWFAREIAGGESIGEGEYKEWFRQQINETRFTDTEFRSLLSVELLSSRMREYLEQFVPTVAEQVFVNMIFVADGSDGWAVKQKYEAGEDFAVLANEYSANPSFGQGGGKVGWFPRGVLDPTLDRLAFQLETGKISDPIPLDENKLVVVMISEKIAAREVDELSLSVLKSKVLDTWYGEAYKDFDVQFHGLSNGYDSGTDAWVQWQLMRMQRGQEKDSG
jgi:parvulin-like peptidyl-prolyl isomerase